MRTVVLGPRPPELDALIARRRSLGLDTHDEVWKGEYHMAPAAVVVEIESPDDETWDKLDFYADHGVDGLLIVSAEAGSVTSLV